MTDITYDKQPVIKMDVSSMGEFVWFRFHFKDGSHKDTLNLRGEV